MNKWARIRKSPTGVSPERETNKRASENAKEGEVIERLKDLVRMNVYHKIDGLLNCNVPVRLAMGEIIGIIRKA